MGILSGQLTIRNQRLRRQGCGPRAGGKRDTACRKSKGEFQKVPAFHDILLLCGPNKVKALRRR